MREYFVHPDRGFVSREPAETWQHSLLTGNGTIGAMIPGNPYDERLYLSHAALFLPSPQAPDRVELASQLEHIQKLCLKGLYAEAAQVIDEVRNACDFIEERDRFIAAFMLGIIQTGRNVATYQRSVDFSSAEAKVSVQDQTGATFTRTVFASRADNVLVLRISGEQPLSVTLSFLPLPIEGEKDAAIVKSGIRQLEHGTQSGYLNYRATFATPNADNPLAGYQGVGRVVASGGAVNVNRETISVCDADEILVLVAIEPLRIDDDPESTIKAMQAYLEALPTDYAALLIPHREQHATLMERVSFQLDAAAPDRSSPTEDLWPTDDESSRAATRIERAFDAGRYNIICSTGYHPPHLQGLWSATWLAPWFGSFTTNGNLQCAIAFLLMGNTPELMDAVFRFHDERWEGFRENARTLFDMPGFHVPAQLTVSPRQTDFNAAYPHCFSHAGAPWILQFYYDYFRYTGDMTFLKKCAYPLMKEAVSFFEHFLTTKDDAGRAIFNPSYSPEHAPGERSGGTVSINATMDVGACRQLLRNCLASAALLQCDDDHCLRWTALLEILPEYEVDENGYFREWLWPGLKEHNQHRHASHLYELFDEMPDDILNHPVLVAAISNTIRARLDFHKRRPVMAFGLVQIGLAASRIGQANMVQEVMEFLASHYWSSGMGSFHDRDNLFNTDISGGFPYLCASALVYADPGRIVFFPARPPSWSGGRIAGLRLRGAMTLQELRWSTSHAEATVVSDTDQTLVIQSPGRPSFEVALAAGTPETFSIHRTEQGLAQTC